jgi:anaerobic magnesium-protoporphyrin IX monomethyl ester cyclase
MLDVLFSHSYYYKFDSKQWKNKTPYPPLGTLYAASFLREHYYTVDLFDTNLAKNPKEIVPYLVKYQPKIFVIYDDCFNYLTKMCLTKMRTAAFEMISIVKEIGCKVIVCSSDASDHFKMYLDRGADFVIQGEGEMTLKELTDCLTKGNSYLNIDGIIYKNQDEIIINNKRSVLKNLDTLPLPAWDLVDMSTYKKVWLSGGKEFTLNIVTTRGCPFKCNWCAKPIYGNRYNSHSPEYIVKHIEYLTNTYGVKRFWMCDDIFGLKPNWVQEFNKELKAKKLSISFYMQSRVDLLLKEDTIDALYESGLEEVWVGAESGSQSILDAMDKGTTVEQIYEATKFLKEKKINVAFFIQFGYLGETIEDINKTIKMIKELQPDNLGVSVSYPLPGTKFYEKVKDDLKYKANWTDSDDLDMMFDGTFHSKYYKRIHRYVHKEYRKSQGITNIKKAISNPFTLNWSQMRSILLLFYYFPSALLDRFQLKSMQHHYA